MMRDEFDVFQELVDGSVEQVRECVPAQEALEVAQHYSTQSIGAAMGVIKRVVIVESADESVVFEWTAGVGITYPPAAARSRMNGADHGA